MAVGTDPTRTATSPWRIVGAPPMQGLDPDAPEEVWAVAGLSDVQHADELSTWGWDDRWAPLFVWLPVLQDATYSARALALAVRDVPDPGAADVLGAVLTTMPRDGNRHLAYGYLVVHPSQRGAGVGSALLARAEQSARAADRTALVIRSAEAPEPPDGPGALTAPTGAGRVLINGQSSRFARRHGFTLEQVERYSVLELGGDTWLRDVAAHHQTAAAIAQQDYRVHTWQDIVPPQWRAQLATLMARMNTDAPSGAVEIDQEPWDAERVRAYCEHAANSFQNLTISAAEHVPSGTLAAYTVLTHPVPDVAFAFQDDTLVHADHRGRRLGMLVKTANLQALHQRRPAIVRVHTTNAQENTHMLAINVALGFATPGVQAVWQKKLDPDPAPMNGSGV